MNIVISHMSVEKIKQLLLMTIGVMILAMGYHIWRYRNEQKSIPPQVIPIETNADVVVKDVELTETSGTRIFWKLRAKKAEVYTSSKETRLEDIEVDFFDEQGQKSMHLVSDSGVKDDHTGNITASGNVQASAYQEGITLKTSELIYDAKANLMTSEKHVVIERGNIVTSGEGLESDLSLSEARILRNVTTSVVLED